MKMARHFSDLMLEEYNRLREDEPEINHSVWDVFISLVGREKNHLLVMKADLPIIEGLAEGQSVIRVSRSLGIPSKAIRRVADIWGIEPMEVALDFNPVLVYNRGMTPEQMKYKLEDILFDEISLETYEKIINNIEAYLDIVKYIEEVDE
jgi:hypothetical protein